ncbi:MAG TPA: hypothetical protein VGY77_04665 [Gemmataceae bacterium]|jgi:hypothetical protein|nr:hypothetical protein [Gemmataceae bacterium]
MNRTLVGALLGVSILVGPAFALSPRDELLRLVSDDVGFCFIVQDLGNQSESFLNSPFIEQFNSSALGLAVRAAPETRKLMETATYFQKQLQIDWVGLRKDILGDAVVLAYWPGPSGKPDAEQGLALIRARDSQVLATMMDRLNEVQKQAGTPTMPRKHNGTDYICWGESKGALCYYRNGPVLAVSHSESALHRVIDLDRQASSKEEPRLTKQMKQLGVDKTLAALLVNPRVFDPEMERKAALARGPESFVLKTLVNYWKALDGIALYGRIRKTDLELGMVIQAGTDRVPGPMRKMFIKDLQASELWRYFPENALLAVAGRVDSLALTEFVSGFIPEEGRKAIRETVDRAAGAAFDKDVVDILPYIGPDWGLCILAPAPAETTVFPHLIAALRILPGEKNNPMDQIALNALNAFSLVAVFSYNSNHQDQLSLKTLDRDNVKIKYFTNEKLFPPGIQPAYAWKDGFLIVASSPSAIQSFHASPSTTETAGSPSEIPVLRLSVREWRRFLKVHSDGLASFIAEKDQITKEDAVRRLKDLITGFELLDRVEIGQRSSPDQFTMVLRLRPAKPLQK